MSLELLERDVLTHCIVYGNELRSQAERNSTRQFRATGMGERIARG